MEGMQVSSERAFAVGYTAAIDVAFTFGNLKRFMQPFTPGTSGGYIVVMVEQQGKGTSPGTPADNDRCATSTHDAGIQTSVSHHVGYQTSRWFKVMHVLAVGWLGAQKPKIVQKLVGFGGWGNRHC
jgi:hypothetical protein